MENKLNLVIKMLIKVDVILKRIITQPTVELNGHSSKENISAGCHRENHQITSDWQGEG